MKHYLLLIILSFSSLAIAQTNLSRIRKVNCYPDEVALYQNRVHLRCYYKSILDRELNKSTNHPIYFSLPLNDPRAMMFWTTINTARQTFHKYRFLMENGQGYPLDLKNFGERNKLEIHYDQLDRSGLSFGCNPKDCRKPIFVVAPTRLTQGD